MVIDYEWNIGSDPFIQRGWDTPRRFLTGNIVELSLWISVLTVTFCGDPAKNIPRYFICMSYYNYSKSQKIEK